MTSSQSLGRLEQRLRVVRDASKRTEARHSRDVAGGEEVVSSSSAGLVLGSGFQSGRFRVDQVRGRRGSTCFFSSSSCFVGAD